MTVLDRSELEASPLADLHAIADQLGLEGFRRLRKADLIDAILGGPTGSDSSAGSSSGAAPPATEGTSADGAVADAEEQDSHGASAAAKRRRRPSVRGRRSRRGPVKDTDAQDAK